MGVVLLLTLRPPFRHHQKGSSWSASLERLSGCPIIFSHYAVEHLASMLFSLLRLLVSPHWNVKLHVSRDLFISFFVVSLGPRVVVSGFLEGARLDFVP